MININKMLVIILSSLVLTSLPLSSGMISKKIKTAESKEKAIICTVFYLDEGKSIKITKYVDIKDASMIAGKLNSTVDLLEKQFEILRENGLVENSIFLDKLNKKYESLKNVDVDNLIKQVIEKYEFPSNVLKPNISPFSKVKLIVYGALGKIGFTTRLPIYGRFGQPLPGFSIVVGTHSLIPGLGVDLSLLNLGIFLGDFSSSISNKEFSGVGVSGVTLGFIGWMTFIIFPGVYTYIWATGYYGINIWLGLFFDKSS